MAETWARARAGLRSAFGLLTVIPVGVDGRRPDGGWADAPGWFGLVGAAVGGAAGGVRLGLGPVLGAGVSSVLALGAAIVLTGALHLDGLADLADGLGVRRDRARRLTVMRDSANGTFATAAVVVWCLLVVAALAGLSGGAALRALVAAGACGRAAALGHARLLAPARTDGLGSGFAPGLGQLAAAVLTALAAALGLLGPGTGAICAGAALGVTLGFAAFVRRAVGGQTGDTLGAAVCLAELATLLGARALLGG